MAWRHRAAQMTQQEKAQKIFMEFLTISNEVTGDEIKCISKEASIECAKILCDYLAKENEKQQHWKRMAHWQQIKERLKRI